MEDLGSPPKKCVKQLVTEVADKGAPLSFKLKNELETFPLDARKEVVNSVKPCETQRNGLPSHFSGEIRHLMYVCCKHGDRNKIEYLIRTCGADIEQKSGGVGDYRDQVTPLWGAANGGHLSTVELLFQSGADINAESSTGSTPLMSACLKHHFEVVKYLLLHGADINKQNYKGNGESCLMNSVRSETLCDFLLKNGADINAKDNQNKTALHYAIQENKLETTKLLLEHGIDHTTKSSDGDDALQMACLKGAIEICEYLNLIISYSPERIANAQELLGATLIKDYSSFSDSLNLWKRALKIRDENGLHPKQPIMPLHESYRNQREFETLDELMAMYRDVDKMTIQSLLITERNLGIHHPHFICRLENGGISYAKVNVDYQRCIDLWRRALQIRTEKDTILHSDTSAIAQTLVKMMLHFRIKSVQNNIGNTDQRFHDIVETFKVVTQNFEEIASTLLIRPHCIKQLDEFEIIFRSISHLIYLLIETAKTKNNKELVIKLLPRVINLRSFLTGDPLLHIFTSRQPEIIRSQRWNTITPRQFRIIDSLYSFKEVKIEGVFPNVNVLKQLLECGANVHARSKCGWTPLHAAVIYRCTSSVKLLLDFGAHIDESDGCGETLFDRIRAFNYDNADVFYFKYTSLKCLCAKQILKNNIPYVDQLPKPLESFVTLHDRNRKFYRKFY